VVSFVLHSLHEFIINLMSLIDSHSSSKDLNGTVALIVYQCYVPWHCSSVERKNVQPVNMKTTASVLCTIVGLGVQHQWFMT